MRETELYEPVRRFLKAQGFTVRAEVHDCDVIAVRGDEIIVVELKTRFSIDLLIQANERRTVTDSVYVALPGPIDLSRRGKWRKKIRLLRRLQIGLLIVHDGGRIEVACHPLPYEPKKQKRRKRALLQEVAGRSADYNRGGSTRRKLMTAYRENAVFIAVCLDKFGPLTPGQLRRLGTGPKTQPIVYNNHYKWFQRLDRGVYGLADRGQSEIQEYPDLVDRFSKRLEDTEPPAG